MKFYRKAILPLGFKASAVASGLKKSKKLDVALFFSAVLAKTACLFTTNTMPAAPVIVNRQSLAKGTLFQAILANSANANCFTGSAGVISARESAASLAIGLGVKRENILLASTGVIGKKLDVQKIKNAIPQLIANLSVNGIFQAKRAILTTDAFTKEASVKINLGSKNVTICGVAKGAGMIAPDMATMLAFIFTDANISEACLKKAVRSCVDNSFNCITVDGCMSTNDSVMVMANGCAGNKLISAGRDLALFSKALATVCLELAKLIVRDAEGGSKFIQIKVCSAKDFGEAKKAALSIANSNLFKTAMYGQNPNFGRIVAALGASAVKAKESDLRIKVSPLHKKDIDVQVFLGRGKASAIVYTSDLTPEYIKINAEYN